MVSELLRKYIWLVQTFIRAGEQGLTLEELSDKWERRFDSPYSRRTFNNHRSGVEDVFNIVISCNRSTNRYFIEYADDVSDENAESAWLINTFTVNNMLSLGKERLQGRVAVEDIPSGHMYLTAVMEAMKENAEVTMSYQKYTSPESERLTVHPYAVKEYAKRWYLIAYCVERGGLRVYGLDRIKGLEMTGQQFEMPKNFDVDELFATSFGIYLPKSKGQTIVFYTNAAEAKFMRDLPIHKSQKEVSIDDDGVTFSIFVCPDRNLIMEFCKYGSRLKVLSPAEIRNAVAEELSKASSQYSK